MKKILFHLAFPVGNIPQTKEFYREGLGGKIGRETDKALIINFYENQMVAHVTKEAIAPQKGIYPRHFGLIFTQESDYLSLLQRAEEKKLKFYQSPKRRFIDTPLEHHTFFLQDPFFNLLEFKFYCNAEAIFGKSDYNQIGDKSQD